MRIGYARISTESQVAHMQEDALRAAGAEKIYLEKCSGVGDRPELAKALDYAREGDEIVVQRIDRLGRDMRDLLDTLGDLDKRGIVIKIAETIKLPPLEC